MTTQNVSHGFDASIPGCVCGDPERWHVLRRVTPVVRLRRLVFDLTGRWCPHIDQVPTVAVRHPAHGSDEDVGPDMDILFCSNCWAVKPV